MKWKKRGDKKFAYKARREDRHNSIAKRLVTSRNHNISFKCFGSWRLFYHILRAIRPEQLIWRYFLDNKRLTSRRDKAVSGQCSSHASDFKSRKNGRAEMNLEGESCVELSKYRYRVSCLDGFYVELMWFYEHKIILLLNTCFGSIGEPLAVWITLLFYAEFSHYKWALSRTGAGSLVHNW